MDTCVPVLRGTSRRSMVLPLIKGSYTSLARAIIGQQRNSEVLQAILAAAVPLMNADGSAVDFMTTIGATRVADPGQPVFALDHNVQDTSEENLAKYRRIEEFANNQGVTFFPAGAGIGHQLMVEQGFVHPGRLVVASDSHSNMYGALGALGTPVVRTDAAAIWATGEFWWQIPRTVKVVLEGRLEGGATGKDVIITLCGLFNQDEVLNHAVEFTGDGVGRLSIDERLTIANMTTEWGALVGWFPVDGTTLDYLRARMSKLGSNGGFDRFSEQEIADWEASPPVPDQDAHYAARIELDLGSVTPHVAGPDTVQTMHSVADLEREFIRVNKAYIVSCVNSRLEDLEAAAAVIKGVKPSRVPWMLTSAPHTRSMATASGKGLPAPAASKASAVSEITSGRKPFAPSIASAIPSPLASGTTNRRASIAPGPSWSTAPVPVDTTRICLAITEQAVAKGNALTIGDTLLNRRFSAGFPLPVILPLAPARCPGRMRWAGQKKAVRTRASDVTGIRRESRS